MDERRRGVSALRRGAIGAPAVVGAPDPTEESVITDQLRRRSGQRVAA